MLHTMAFLGLGRTHDEALRMAATIADRTFASVFLLNGQRVSQLDTLLLPDQPLDFKQVALVYLLDIPAGAEKALDARHVEVEQEVRAERAIPRLDQVFFSFRSAIGLSPRSRASRQLGPYTIQVEQEVTTMYMVRVRIRDAEPHVTKFFGTIDECVAFFKEIGVPLEGWLADEAIRERQETAP